MRFWQSGAVLTVLIIVVLLAACELLARAIPGLRRLGLPLPILAGILGLVLGEQVLNLYALDIGLLELLVYHGLAIVFIAIGLETPKPRAGGGSGGGGERGSGRASVSMAHAIVVIMASQAAIGLAVVLALDTSLHPGFGLLLPMGFEEGPGQGLTIGASWESSGLEDGAQVGLIIAVMGFAWSVFGGVPLVLWGRRRGWVRAPDEGEPGPEAGVAVAGPDPATGREASEAPPGSLDRLTLQVALVGICYLLTWAVCSGAASLLSSMPDIADVVWGVHFIIGAGVAIGVRLILARMPGGTPVDNHLVGRVGGLTVDFITCAALAAVQFAVLQSHWLPIVLVTALGGLWTLGFSIWIARRAWTEAPFEHAVLFYGMSTGTLPTGLTLLRMIDPNMRSPAPVSAVFGSVGAIAGGGILIMGLFPATVSAFGDNWPGGGWLMLGIMIGFCIAVVISWRVIGGLRFRRPLLSPWPDLPVGEAGDAGPSSTPDSASN